MMIIVGIVINHNGTSRLAFTIDAMRVVAVVLLVSNVKYGLNCWVLSEGLNIVDGYDVIYV